MSEPFDPEKVDRYSFDDNCAGCCGCGLGETAEGDYVLYEDYDQLKALLHDVATEADPAGTLRDLRLAQDTIKAQEVLIEELRAEIERLRRVAYSAGCRDLWTGNGGLRNG